MEKENRGEKKRQCYQKEGACNKVRDSPRKGMMCHAGFTLDPKHRIEKKTHR